LSREQGQVVATARCVVVIFNYQLQRPTRIPDDLRRAFERSMAIAAGEVGSGSGVAVARGGLLRRPSGRWSCVGVCRGMRVSRRTGLRCCCSVCCVTSHWRQPVCGTVGLELVILVRCCQRGCRWRVCGVLPSRLSLRAVAAVWLGG
ncbi:MAG: hypothetical protein ACK56I_16120, partial [bacterium]